MGSPHFLVFETTQLSEKARVDRWEVVSVNVLEVGDLISVAFVVLLSISVLEHVQEVFFVLIEITELFVGCRLLRDVFVLDIAGRLLDRSIHYFRGARVQRIAFV